MTKKIVPPKTQREKQLYHYYISFIESDEKIPENIVSSFLEDVKEVSLDNEIYVNNPLCRE